MYRQLLNPSVLKHCNAHLCKSTSSIANNLSINSLDLQIRLPSTYPIAQSTIDNFSSLYPKKHFSFYQSATNWADSAERKPLVVLFAWLYSSDKNVHKYRELYLTRGIDGLTVRYSLGQFLFPPLWTNGCKQNAVNAIRFLIQDSHYEQCIFHTLSAGCYQMIEMLVMTEPEQRQQDRARIASMVRGVILDSPLNHKTLVPGL